MKHTLMVTFIFLGMFVLAQFVGLILLNSQVEVITDTDGSIVIALDETILVDRPTVSGFESLIYIIVGVGIGTLILLFLVKKKQVNLWRLWFLLAVVLAITIAMGAIFPDAPLWLSILVSVLLTVWKIFFPNVYIQNTTEMLMYAGMALLLVPILDVVTAIIILVLFSVYDAYAVWKSKHMVAMAEFTTDANLFPGFTLSYSSEKNKTKLFHKLSRTKKNTAVKSSGSSGRKTGILGGGDVVFPMLFAGAVMLDLIGRGFSKQIALNLSMIIVLGAAAALTYLFVFGKRDKFYPAMPFLTTGCLVGFGVMWLIIFLV